MKLEICVDSFASLQNAIANGADRVELCSALSLGGLSPSYGTLLLASEACRSKVFVMVRPRAGDFLYTDSEFEVMCKEVENAKKLGFPGIVVGMLTPDGNIDLPRLKRLIAEARPMSVTFHRAFDNGGNPHRMIEDLISAGVDRLLTSGQQQDAIKGAELIRRLQAVYGTKIRIMPGAGITSENLEVLIALTGCEEYHLSAKTFIPSLMHLKKKELPIPDAPSWYNDGEEIQKAREILYRAELGATGGASEKDTLQKQTAPIKNVLRHRHSPKYDPEFYPIINLIRTYRELLEKANRKNVLTFSILRNREPVETVSLDLLDDEEKLTPLYAERIIKTYLWIVGGNGISIDGPNRIFEHIKNRYREDGDRNFDIAFFTNVFGRKFEVFKMSKTSETTVNTVKKNRGNIRIGLDLGGSTLKLTLLDKNTVLYRSEEIWTPKTESDPDYHFEKIVGAIENAMSHVKKDVDEIAFIGYSAAGIVLQNRIIASSLFRCVPESAKERTLELFDRISQVFADVPYRIVNDGEISALAATKQGKKHGILGLTLGTSLGCGYLNPSGKLTDHIRELAFVPLDLSDSAIADEWSGDTGVGVSYLSQDAVIKLAIRAGLPIQGDTPSERFRSIARLAEQRDETATEVFKDIGIYLAYAVAYYSELFEFKTLMLLGGVAAGRHGVIILTRAKEVLSDEFPDLYAQLEWISADLDAHLQDGVAAELETMTEEV